MGNAPSIQVGNDKVGTQALLYSCIDIGTNSVKLLTADLGPSYPARVYEHSIISRLGEGMRLDSPLFQPEPITRTLAAVGEFYEESRRQNTKELIVVGTAALREAKNRDELLKPLKDKWGVSVEILSGEEEARLSYMAVRKDPHWNDQAALVVVDIGGGSTEIISGRGMSIISRVSTPLGAVRITERYLQSDPPTTDEIQNARKQISDTFPTIPDNAKLKEFVVVGVGGTISCLGCMKKGQYLEPEKLHGTELTSEELTRQIKLLEASSHSTRKEIPGLDPRRADIILGGAQILDRVMTILETDRISISTRGLRWGVLYDKFLS